MCKATLTVSQLYSHYGAHCTIIHLTTILYQPQTTNLTITIEITDSDINIYYTLNLHNNKWSGLMRRQWFLSVYTLYCITVHFLQAYQASHSYSRHFTSITEGSHCHYKITSHFTHKLISYRLMLLNALQ